MGNNIKWKEFPINYVINPTNNDGLSDVDVQDTIQFSAETWDSEVTIELFNNGYLVNYDASVNLNNPITNDANEIVFGDIEQSGVIAVCIVWYINRGPPSQRRIVEFDILFDDTDFTWGYAGPTRETDLGDTNIMDLGNIITHELGHALGLADLYFAEASEQTMYGYGELGETKKRTLESGDIAGITFLYG